MATSATDKKRAKQKTAFLTALQRGWSVTKATELAGCNRVTAYKWREADEEFAADWDDAVEAGTDCLEDIAIERATESSDTLLIFMLKGRRPSKFKDRIQQEHTGKDGGPIEINDARNQLEHLINRHAAGTGAGANTGKTH